jgi:RNA polymerase sigma factor (sigma-70 family)
MEKNWTKYFFENVPSDEFQDCRGGNVNIIDEEILWKKFKDGDEPAFIYIYNTYYKILLNLGVQFTKDSELVKDCVQDLFIDIRENKEKLGNVKHIKSYLMVSFKRRLLDYLSQENKRKDKKLEIVKEMFEIHVSHEDVIIEGQKQLLNVERLKNALNQLSKKEVEAIYYFYYQNLSYKEISDLFNYSQVKTARNLVYMALDKLRTIMKI